MYSGFLPLSFFPLSKSLLDYYQKTACLIKLWTSRYITKLAVCFHFLLDSNFSHQQPLYLMQVSRSIGDVYMKHAHFNREPINAKFRLPEPMKMPIMSATPSILSHPIQPNDSFLIFASDGLWEHLSNEKAVEIVQNNPHAVRFCPLSFFFFVLIFLLRHRGRLCLRCLFY